MTKLSVFVIANLLFFQVGWFVCVLLGSVWGLAFTALALLFHFYTSTIKLEDGVALVVVLVLGVVHDAILMHANLIQFPDHQLTPPLWLMCLWVLLGITLNHSMKWIYEKPVWAAIFGAVFAPLSYLAGAKLSGAHWSSSIIVAMSIIAIMWLFILPAHRWLSLRVLSYVKVIRISS